MVPVAELLPLVPTLRHQLTDAFGPDDPKRTTTLLNLEMLPYSLGATQDALHRYLQIHADLATSAVARMGAGVGLSVLSPAERDSLAYTVDSFLEAGRRTQNAVVPYLTKALRVSLPPSLADLAEDLEKGKHTLDAQITSLIGQYWRGSGQTLKDYRDLSQHFSLASSDVRVTRGDEHGPLLQMLLPNNPSTKSTAHIEFGNPPIHAFPYMEEAFRWLVAFTRKLTAALIRPAGGERAQAAVNLFRTPIVLGPGARQDGVRMVTMAEVDAKVRRLLGLLDAEVRPQE
jgi:hypothetical protein